MTKGNYLFTSESVSEGHPDKVADQISDAILDEFLAHDKDSKVACETLVTTGQVIVAGEVKSNAYIDLMDVTRRVINEIGYNRSELRFDGSSCGVLSALHEQSPDINRGVERRRKSDQGAGDQGMMFGYASDETPNYMPLPLDLSHTLLRELSAIRREGKLMTYLRPDAKSQVTVEYGPDNRPARIHTIVISTQHDEFITPDHDGVKNQDEADKLMLAAIRKDVKEILLPRVVDKLPDNVKSLFDKDLILHGGGAFSGKDPSKVDRSAAYAARHMAKNLVAAGVAREVLVQVAYAIGVAEPVSLNINTFGTANVKMSDAEISRIAEKLFDMRPASIEKRLKLRNPIYQETASYGHVGREPQTVEKTFSDRYDSAPLRKEVELFTWEKLDMVDRLQKIFAGYRKKQ